MTENGQSEKTDNDHEDALSVNLGVFSMTLTGKMLGTFLPYAGWALLIMAAAYAATVVIGALRQ